MKIRIVIVEKHAAVRRALGQRLSAVPHLDVIAAVQEPIAVLPYLNLPGEADTPDLVVLGLRRESDEAFLATLDVIRQITGRSAAVIVLPPYADEVERVLLCQAGATSYLLKNIDSPRLIQEIEAVARFVVASSNKLDTDKRGWYG